MRRKGERDASGVGGGALCVGELRAGDLTHK